MTNIQVSTKQPGKSSYETPRIMHKGQLKQFSGSPLSNTDALGLGGLPNGN